MSGQPATPIPILKARGSWRANINKNPPEPERVRPTKPRFLNKEAGVVWRTMVEVLDDMGVLTKVDGIALARYCHAWVRWRKLAKYLDDNGEGFEVKDEAGNIKMYKKWPQATAYIEVGNMLSRLEGEFGLTPSARSRITVAEPKTKETDKDKNRFFATG